MPNKGPIRMPIKISGSTSGTRVRSKIAVKKWAAKMISPIENTKVDMVSIYKVISSLKNNYIQSSRVRVLSVYE